MKRWIWTVTVCAALTGFAKDTVFFVGCHPDDIENCLGLMLRMREKYDIQVIDFTRGENGCGTAGYADGTTAVKRIAEEREVCKAFGCEPIFLSEINHNGMAYAGPRVTAEIEKLLLERKPKAVFVNWPVDGHPDHVQCSAATMHAVWKVKREHKFSTELYFYEEPPGEGQNFNCHCYYVDVSAEIDEACALCCKWACQNGDRIAAKKRIRLAKHGATAPKPVAFAEVYTTFMGDEIKGGVLEEFAVSPKMIPVTWNPDMYWWYKGEFGPKKGGGLDVKPRKGVHLKKLGTYDIFIVEANPIVFKGRLLMMEYIRYTDPEKRYRFNDTGDSYFRFREMSDMKTFTPSFGAGLHMGNAFVAGDKVVVTAVEKWGGSRIVQMESADLVHWSAPRVILSDPKWAAYNTTMCRAGDRYVLGFELGKPSELVGKPFTMFFAESRDLVNWSVVKGARMGADIYTGAPMLRHFGDWFYFFHLEGSYEEGFVTRVMRSKDLYGWELSPEVVLSYDSGDKAIHPRSTFSDDEKSQIAAAADVNASDLDMCEWQGKLVSFYSWGDQRGHEYSALATADCAEREFCESFFK